MVNPEEALSMADELLTAAGHDVSTIKYRVRKEPEWIGGMTKVNDQSVWKREAFLEQCKRLNTMPYTLHAESETGTDLLTLKFF